MPEPGCLTALKSSLQIKFELDQTKNQLKWKWSNGQSVTQEALGDPLSSTNYVLCIYDHTGDVADLASSLVVAPDPAWDDKTPNGWLYKDTTGAQGGVTKLLLKPSADDKSKAQLQAKGVNYIPSFPVGGGEYFDQDTSVIVQLFKLGGPGSSTCWTSTFAATDTTQNDEDGFKASVP